MFWRNFTDGSVFGTTAGFSTAFTGRWFGLTTSQSIKVFPHVIERAIKYESKVTEHFCRLLRIQDDELVLHHHVKHGFSISLETCQLNIVAGSHTFAYYWLNRPYNAYYWIDSNGEYIGTYLNLVRETQYSPPVLSFQDLIVDVICLPDGTVEVLDEDELPVPMKEFENGTVQAHLKELRNLLGSIVSYLTKETSKFLDVGVLRDWNK